MSETDICNQALGVIGALRIDNLDDTSEPNPQTIQCRLHYEQTRDALIRSHYWRFASTRANLTEDSESPDFEFDNQFDLPDDFMRLKSVFGDNSTATENTRYSFAIEGQLLLTNDSTVELRYIKKVTDVTEFDPLFIEVLILKLALKLTGPLTGGSLKIKQAIHVDLKPLMSQVRAIDRQETNTIGRLNRRPWAEARLQGGGTWRQDRV